LVASDIPVKINSKPNDLAKTFEKAVKNPKLSEIKLKQLDFWTQFKVFAENKDCSLKLLNPIVEYYYMIKLDAKNVNIFLYVLFRKSEIRCECYIRDLYISDKLFFKKEEINKEINCELDWDSDSVQDASKITTILNIDVKNKEKWDECFKWLFEKSKVFHLVFSKYLNK